MRRLLRGTTKMFEFINNLWGTAYVIAGGLFGVYVLGVLANAYFSFRRNLLLKK